MKPTDEKARWIAVDDYITRTVVAPDAALQAALDASDAAGLPQISVSPAHGKLLYLLARLANARRILEIGTLGGYSTIWLARGLAKGGDVVSLELMEKHAEVARANFVTAGVADRIDVRVGRAIDTLPVLEAEQRPPFDLVFIDADKPGNPDYFRWAMRLVRKGAVIVVDNVVRSGAVADADSTDESVIGVRQLNELIASEPTVSATSIQTVGVKGYDGFTIAIVDS